MAETRTLFHGGTVFDGTGAPPGPADVVVEGSRIVDIGIGLDGDEAVDCAGHAVLPGLFDCHVHLMLDGVDPMKWLHDPFSLPFYRSIHTMRATLATGITTVRDAGGADLGLKEAQRTGLVAGPRTQISPSSAGLPSGSRIATSACGNGLPTLPGRWCSSVSADTAALASVRP